MKKLIFTTLITVLSCTFSTAQTTKSVSECRGSANYWYMANKSVSLPKGAKKKTIEFQRQGYYLMGMFEKGKLAEGQEVSFCSTLDLSSVFLDGIVQYDATGKIKITGRKYDKADDGRENVTYGIFSISNSEDGMFCYKPKKAETLSISVDEPHYFFSYYLNSPVAVCVVKPQCIVVEGRSEEFPYDRINAPLKNEDILANGYDAIVPLLLSIHKNITIVDGAETFRGEVWPEQLKNGSIKFVLGFGTKQGIQKGYKRISIEPEGLGAKMTLSDNPQNKILKSEILYVPSMDNIPLEDMWKPSLFYENLLTVDLNYINGNSYSGEAIVGNPVDNGEPLYEITPTEGKYCYRNGDYFEGNLSKPFVCGIPVDGTMHLKDGTIFRGNWLKGYGLTQAQYNSLTSKPTPSDIKAAADQYKADNNYSSYMAEAKKAESGRKFAVAKKYYEAAKEIKPSAEKWDEKIKELDKKIEYEEFRKKLMSKYGSVVGNKLAGENFEIGMTKEMIVDAWTNKQALLHAFRVSSSTDWDGNMVEIWEYDYSMVQKYMQKELGSEAAGIFSLLSALGATQGINMRSEISKDTKYKYFKFKNGKLIELKDSSIYDDIDNAADDFSRSLLFGF